MQSPDLSNCSRRCVCGAPITVSTWERHDIHSTVVSMRVHDKRYDQQLDHFVLHHSYDAKDTTDELLYRGERALSKECPTRAPVAFGEVTITPAGPAEYARLSMQLPQNWAYAFGSSTPKPSVNPSFGKPVARKIVR